MIINKKPSVFEQGIRYTYNPIFEAFLAKLEKVGFKARPATRDEVDPTPESRFVDITSNSLEESQVALGRSQGKGPEASEFVHTWCGMAVFDHEIRVGSDEWAKIKSIWAGLSSEESC